MEFITYSRTKNEIKNKIKELWINIKKTVLNFKKKQINNTKKKFFNGILLILGEVDIINPDHDIV